MIIYTSENITLIYLKPWKLESTPLTMTLTFVTIKAAHKQEEQCLTWTVNRNGNAVLMGHKLIFNETNSGIFSLLMLRKDVALFQRETVSVHMWWTR